MMVPVPKILLLVSGGADSVFLFWQLLKCKQAHKLDFAVVHFNHHLRGLESEADAAFVQNLCVKNAVEYFAIDLQFNAKTGLQNNARKLRYQKACELAKRQGFTTLATAHHSDDQLETLCMRKARGSGLKGLCGILPLTQIQGLKLWRPLLHWSKNDIKQSLADSQREFREDHSNSSQTYFRNRVRLALNTLGANKTWRKCCLEHNQFLQSLDVYFNKRLKIEAKARVPFIAKAQHNRLTRELQFRLTQRRAQEFGLKKEWRQQDFLKIQHEKAVLTLDQLVIVHDQFGLWFLTQSSTPQPSPCHLPQSGAYFWGRTRLKVLLKEVCINDLNLKDKMFISSKNKFPLQISVPKTASTFLPYGRQHQMRVVDFLKDAKVNRWLRPHWPVLTDHDQNILAILNLEIADAARVLPQDTTALCLQVVWPR